MSSNSNSTKIQVDGQIQWSCTSFFALIVICCQRRMEVYAYAKRPWTDVQYCHLALHMYVTLTQWGTLMMFLRILLVLWVCGTWWQMKTFWVSFEKGTSLWATIRRLWNLPYLCRFLFETPYKVDSSRHLRLVLHWRTSSMTTAQCEKNMQMMLHLWRRGVIVHLRHSELGAMFTLGTFLQCVQRMEIYALFGLLEQSRTQILTLHMQMLFSCSTRFQYLLNISMQILMLGGTPKRGVCGVRIAVSFQIGCQLAVSWLRGSPRFGQGRMIPEWEFRQSRFQLSRPH